MPKFNVFVRKFWMSLPMSDAISKAVITTDQLAPGQLRSRGGWYYLTYLRIVKLKNWNPVSYELESKDMNSVKVSVFKIENDKLIVNGSKNDIKEIAAYFEALIQPKGDGKSAEVNPDEFYKIQMPIVDLQNVLAAYETEEKVGAINKVRMRAVQVQLGKIDNCIINTNDYGKVRSLLGEEDGGVFGAEFALKQPINTLVYYDLDGQVRVSSKNEDVDVERMTIEATSKI